jgi:hypothetical protein
MPPEPRLRRFLSTLAIFFLGLALGGCSVGVKAVGVPSPDASSDARRLEDKVMHISGNLFLIGSFLSLVAFSGRFLIGRNTSIKIESHL